jgi:hypothetical protein
MIFIYLIDLMIEDLKNNTYYVSSFFFFVYSGLLQSFYGEREVIKSSK